LPSHTRAARHDKIRYQPGRARERRFESSEAFGPEIAKPAGEILIREHDFIFPETTVDDLNSQPHNMTAVFIADSPRAESLQRSPDENIPDHWHYGTVVAKVIAEEREHFMKSIRALDDHIAELNEKLRVSV
jgi:arylsulfatase A-like enzyme